ncbi:MAG: DUF262 domain-containing protein [Lachnospiraceae bacterium]|nr:DUF262 domain-containing protein [Lachnospiraceae bacterium]
MSKLNIDQQTIKELFSNKKADFLIPDYQRPYAWDEAECQTLWDDIFAFAFPNNDYSEFDSENDEYFLGPIVTFKNENGKQEIIDGQQRLTTLMLLLRAFYCYFGNMQDENSKKTAEDIGRCIWKTDEFGTANKNKLKIDSEVSTDDDKDQFLSILKTGQVEPGQKSKYAQNYRFFLEKIEEFLRAFPSFFAYLPNRIMNNCILLPIEAESQDTALRIFSTLNDRGKPLSDTDIFKAQFYKYYSDKGQKEAFINRWKELEAVSDQIFTSISGSPMDELFTRYMYYERAKQGNKNTTTEALRKFYERDKYKLLKNDEILDNLESLAGFWKKIELQDDSFSDRVLKLLSILNYAPNGMWTYLLSVYYMANKDENDKLDDEGLYQFLNKLIAFIWAYAVLRPGVNALRSPAYPEMINIVNGNPIEFSEYKFDKHQVKTAFENYVFTNQRPITKSMLAWWAYSDADQKLIPIDMVLEIEHIFPRKRQDNERALQDKNSLESLGNKALLEKTINIRASDYRFEDKKKYYMGYVTESGKTKSPTGIVELRKMAASKDDYLEKDITDRTQLIIDSFIKYLADNGLLLV